MTILVTTTREVLPENLELAKAHLRVDHDDDDTTISDSLRSAVEYIETQTALVLSPTGFEQWVDSWPCGRRIELERGPVREVESIKFFDVDGVEQTVPPASWRWEVGSDHLYLLDDYSLPTLQSKREGSIRVRFKAGYNNELKTHAPPGPPVEADPKLNVPPQASQAVLLLLGHFYENREAVLTGSIQTPFSFSVDALMTSIRRFR